MKYQYLNISKGEDSYIVSSEFYKFRIEFSYDEDGTLLLHSFFGPGISLDDLEELEQFVMEEFEEDFEDCEEEDEDEKDTKAEISTLFRAVKADKSGKIWQALKGLKNDAERIEALTEWCTDAEWFDKAKALYNIGKDENWNKLNQENTKKSEQNAFEFHYEADLKTLNESPEKFFSTFYINGYVVPQEVVENTVPEEFCKQINEFYKVEFFELAKTKWQEDKTLAACIDAENEIDTLYKAVKAKKGWVWEAFTGKTDKARKSELANWLKDERFNREIHEDYPAEYGSASSLSLHAYDCCGYLFCRIRAIQEEYADILSIPSSCGILIFDVEHIYGIIEFEGFRRAFADVWNRQRGPQAPKLYPTDLNSMYLVKKFTANDAGKITESGWDYFFSNFPSTVTRTYNEFLNK